MFIAITWTVPRLYASVLELSISISSQLLQQVKDKTQDMFTKSGLMLGLGEQKEERTKLWRILGVRELTFCLGAVLAKDNTDVHRYVTPEEFEQYKHMAHTKGFSMVASSPLAQPSHYGVITNFIGLKSMYSKNKSVLI